MENVTTELQEHEHALVITPRDTMKPNQVNYLSKPTHSLETSLFWQTFFIYPGTRSIVFPPTFLDHSVWLSELVMSSVETFAKHPGGLARVPQESWGFWFLDSFYVSIQDKHEKGERDQRFFKCLPCVRFSKTHNITLLNPMRCYEHVHLTDNESRLRLSNFHTSFS